MLILSYLICWRNPATKITIRFCTARGWFGWPWTCCPLLSCRMHRPGRRLSDPFGFAGEVSRVAQRGFVTIEGLLDEEIATAIHQETLLETLLETREILGAICFHFRLGGFLQVEYDCEILWSISREFQGPEVFNNIQYHYDIILYQFVSKERTTFPLVVFRIHSRCSHCMKSWRCESVSLWSYIMNSTSIPSTEM